MKKIIVSILLIIILFIVGFYLYNENNKQNEIKKELLPLAEDYFDKYVSTNTTSNTYIVTLEDLKKAPDNYNLKKINCKDAKVSFVVNYKTAKIIKKTVELNCN